MALESATFINQLIPANPTGGDDRSQGDDHIRLVKNVLKNSFPNITNVVNATAAQLNSASTHYVPTGGIIMWSGSIISSPSGWLLCDGTLGTPNLVDKFIRGASDAEGKEPGFLGGSNSYTVPAGSVDATSLTEAQLPVHSHKFLQSAEYSTRDEPNNLDITRIAGAPPIPPDAIVHGTPTLVATDYLSNVGNGDSHTHTTPAVVVTTIPAYYALAYIMKN